ncbi:hypothetical protein CERSUDRAFT_89256 [Gelatoporia subvermispora B]|uniref:DUF6534 domain-containing protein n=1 Tax=Ceriporiopsis subvermispora (strain B) TaxID=914234 RepID=M2P7D5_CERS8|nr:hypothetical protein CERSUDRAFT_89256 [Gelatoporia subvermispora B]
MSLGTTFGAILLGLVTSAVLYGITTVQTYIYFRRYGDDKPVLKYTVSVLWVLDTFHQVLVTHIGYTLLVVRWGSLTALVVPPWSIPATIICTVISDSIVRLLYAYRLLKLSGGNYWITLPTVIGSAMNLAASTAYTAQVARLDFDKWATVKWSFYWGTAGGYTADLWLAICFVAILIRSRTGFRRTDSVIRRLMVYCVNTTLLTSLTLLVMVVTFTVMPDNLVYIAFYMLWPKLLLNAGLATYNARDSLRGDAHSPSELLSIPLSHTSYASAFGSTRAPTNPVLNIHIEKLTETDATGGSTE